MLFQRLSKVFILTFGREIVRVSGGGILYNIGFYRSLTKLP